MIELEVKMAVLQQQLDEDEEWEKAKQNSTGELMLDIPYAVGLCGSIVRSDLFDALSFEHACQTSLEIPIYMLLEKVHRRSQHEGVFFSNDNADFSF
jgi:hypothetical protein